MKNLGSKLAFVLFVTILGAWFIYPPEENLKPGIDLSGGTILVYQALPPGGDETVKPNLEDLISKLKKRLNPDGLQDITIRASGENQVEIILPRATPEVVELTKNKITDVGSLKFRILANRRDDSDEIKRLENDRDLSRLPATRSGYEFIKLGERVEGRDPQVTANTITDLSQTWTRNYYAGRVKVAVTGTDRDGKEATREFDILRNTSNTLTLREPHRFEKVSSYEIVYNPSSIVPDPAPTPASPYVRTVEQDPGRTLYYVLAVDDRYDVTGKELSSVGTTVDNSLKNVVTFTFNREGARKFGNLTRQYSPKEGGNFQYRLAIVLDNVVMSAPVIESVIKDSGQISNPQGFSQAEVQYLVDILSSGSLPTSLNPEPLFEETIGPTLGEDTIAKGRTAILVAMIAVPIFMILYYRAAGAVAVVALTLNMFLLLASMAAFQTSFTLPGLAGLALTVGMAVDANILIFERMREERERGANLIQQVRNGFARAWSTILDTNVTTILSGLVLVAIGTEEIKGFAITLILGLIWNLFTAVFVSRLIFELLIQRRVITRLTIPRLFQNLDIDFIGKRRAFMIGSAVVILAGLLAVGSLGKKILNIDFTGGTLVTIRLKDESASLANLSETDQNQVKAFLELNDARRVAWVRNKVAELPDVTVETLNVGAGIGVAPEGPAPSEAAPNAETAAPRGYRYNIRTSAQNPDEVRSAVIAAFGPVLDRVEIKASEGAIIPPRDENSDRPNKFAGGRRHTLELNIPQSPSRVADFFSRILASDQGGPAINNPDTRFEIRRASIGANEGPDSPARELILETNLAPETANAKLAELQRQVPGEPSLLFERFTYFSGQVAGQTQIIAVIAVVASWAIIAVYLWFRFKSLVWGLAAIIALIHDVLIALGFVAFAHYLAAVPVLGSALQIQPFKIDLPMIAAFLTLIGFSVNDTIVVFDRIREIRGKSPKLKASMINEAINLTLSRTILTSLTTWGVAMTLYFFGGEGIHGFSYTLVIGLMAGTYSTIFIATPILVDFLGADLSKPADAPGTAGPVAKKPAGAAKAGK